METYILRWSYWLGVLSVLLAAVARVFNMLGWSTMLLQTRGNPVSFRTFVNGAMLLLVTAISSAAFIWFKRQNT
jgi:hypothetical protein